MEYFRAFWNRDSGDSFETIFHEIDDDRREWRRVRMAGDGGVYFADYAGGTGNEVLSLIEFPSLAQIRRIPGVHAEPISEEAFEEVWQLAALTGEKLDPIFESLPESTRGKS